MLNAFDKYLQNSALIKENLNHWFFFPSKWKANEKEKRNIILFSVLHKNKTLEVKKSKIDTQGLDAKN